MIVTRQHLRTGRGAFSLLELMIAIVILGIGMVMVATMFPVAWTRARTLSEFTTFRAAADNAHATVSALARVTGPIDNSKPNSSPPVGSFAGDLIFEVTGKTFYSACTAWPNDTWVHALNLGNVLATPRTFVDDAPWSTEKMLDLTNPSLGLGSALLEDSYQHRQIDFQQRLYPPLPPRKNVDRNGRFSGVDDEWDDAVDSRRFVWAVLHKLRGGRKQANQTNAGAVRRFDMYYVLLRRPQPTLRYARQDPASAPDPCTLGTSPASPTALPAAQDVQFPVAWRVQVQFPSSLEFKLTGVPLAPNMNITGLPTEIDVPPPGSTADPVMLVGMFQRGTRFVDEVSGEVFTVENRRVAPDGNSAVLTLDREVFVEDFDLLAGDPRCACNPRNLDPEEQLRAVWVYPPPVADRGIADTKLVFVGRQPVVDIDVRSLSVRPRG